MTTTETSPLTQGLGKQIAIHLTPGPWNNVQDDYDDTYAIGQRVTLRYAGEDATLEGALVTGFLPRGDPSVEWSCHMWGPGDANASNLYLVDKLPHAIRKAWPGCFLNISIRKSPERIGRELSRRLLSYYLPAYRAGIAALQRERDEQAQDGILAAELAAIAGTEARQWKNQRGLAMWHVSVGPAAQLGLVCEYGRVYVQGFTMSHDQARQLVHLVQTWKNTS